MYANSIEQFSKARFTAALSSNTLHATATTVSTFAHRFCRKFFSAMAFLKVANSSMIDKMCS